MSLESIHRVLSHAYKAASEANSGTADEKGALDVLGGLTALVESRIQLHKHAAPTTAVRAAGSLLKERPLPTAAAQAAPSQTPAESKSPSSTQANESYDLK